MNIGGVFAEFAQAFALEESGPFWLGRIVSQTDMVFDDGGSLVVPPTGPWQRDCVVQVDRADEAMRGQEGYAETDRKFILPADFAGTVTTDHQVEIRNGPYAGLWGIESVSRDSMASGWVLRGRKA